MKILKSFLIVLLVSGWTVSSSQDRPLAQPVKKEAPAEKNKTDKKSDAPQIHTDKQGRTYQIVEGRKVLVDSQGNQSLAAPKETEPKPLQEKTTK